VTFIADALDTLEREAAIPPVASTAIKLLFLTGCRKGEILSLRWDYVDFDRHCFRLPDSKTGAKIVPIAAAALAILSGLSRTTTWVLPATKGQGHYVGLQKHWEAVKLTARALCIGGIRTRRQVSSRTTLRQCASSRPPAFLRELRCHGWRPTLLGRKIAWPQADTHDRNLCACCRRSAPSHGRDRRPTDRKGYGSSCGGDAGS
jgi:integrase